MSKKAKRARKERKRAKRAARARLDVIAALSTTLAAFAAAVVGAATGTQLVARAKRLIEPTKTKLHDFVEKTAQWTHLDGVAGGAR